MLRGGERIARRGDAEVVPRGDGNGPTGAADVFDVEENPRRGSAKRGSWQQVIQPKIQVPGCRSAAGSAAGLEERIIEVCGLSIFVAGSAALPEGGGPYGQSGPESIRSEELDDMSSVVGQQTGADREAIERVEL